MPLVDGRGRLFGRLNIIDAALLAFVLLLLPIGYTASRLFRVQQPGIDRVEPAQQPVGPARRIRVQGHDFRPYLKAFVSRAGEPFSLITRLPTGIEGLVRLETPSTIGIELPNIAAGAYDLYLYDETHEIARLANAFILKPPPETVLRVRVRLATLPDVAAMIHEGDVDIPDDSGAVGLTTPSAKLITIRELGGPVPAVSASAGYGVSSGASFWSLDAGARQAEAVVYVPAQLNARGVWEYSRQPIRAGDTFTFHTAAYTVQGIIEQVSILNHESDR